MDRKLSADKSDSEAGSHGHQVPSSQPRKKRAGCRRWGCTFLWLVLAAVICLPILFGISFRALLGPDRLAELAELDTTIVQIPPEWQKPALLPSEAVIKFNEEFYKDVDAVNAEFGEVLFNEGSPSQTMLARLRRGDEVTSAEQQTLDSFMRAMQPLIEKTSASVEMPGYTADMFLYTKEPSWLPMQNFAKFASMAALLQARRGDCRTAMETVLLPVRQGKVDHPPTLMTQLIIIADSYISVSTMNDLAAQCDDAGALRHGLDLLTQLKDQAMPTDALSSAPLDRVAVLKRASAFGFPVNLERQTLASLAFQNLRVFGLPYNEWAVAHFPKDDPRAAVARQTLQSLKTSGQPLLKTGDFVGPLITYSVNGGPGANIVARVFKLATRVSVPALAASVANVNYVEVQTRARVYISAYNSVMLHLAQRLNELHAPPIYPGQEGVKAYLQSIPQDPFISAPMKLEPTEKTWYSVGPDEDDDKLSVVYDASNGTRSDGDVTIIRR